MERMNYLMYLDDKQSDLLVIEPTTQQQEPKIKTETPTTNIKSKIPYYLLAGGLLLIFFS